MRVLDPVLLSGDPAGVLSHEVDMKVPVHSGTWHTAQLHNDKRGGLICGGMVWSAERVGSTTEAAARLLFEMENANAPVNCLKENEDVMAQGVRFLNRSDWEDGRGPSTTEVLCYVMIVFPL